MRDFRNKMFRSGDFLKTQCKNELVSACSKMGLTKEQITFLSESVNNSLNDSFAIMFDSLIQEAEKLDRPKEL